MSSRALLAAAVWLSASLAAQDPAKLDAARIASGEFAGQDLGALRWLDDGHFTALEPGADGARELVRYAAVTGEREVLRTTTALDDYTWSPDGARLLAFVAGEDGHGVLELWQGAGDAAPRRLGATSAGLRAACFSSDGARVAWFDEANRRLGVAAVDDGEPQWLAASPDTAQGALGRLSWRPNADELLLQWLSPAGDRLVVYAIDVASGAPRVVHEQRDAARCEVPGEVRWLDEQRFLATSDVVFRSFVAVDWSPHDAQPTLGLPLSNGFDVVAVLASPRHRYDGWLLCAGADADEIRPRSVVDATEQHLYETNWKLGGIVPPRCLTARTRGWHDCRVSPDGSLAIHTHSSFGAPPVVHVERFAPPQAGQVATRELQPVRVLTDNRAVRERYAALARGTHSFFCVEVQPAKWWRQQADVELDGWMMRPPGFDDSKSWPVVFFAGGPGVEPAVVNRWGGERHLLHLWLTQLGYVVVAIDARGVDAPKGRWFRKPVEQVPGETAVSDWLAAVTKMCERHAWIDRSRLFVWGEGDGGARAARLLAKDPQRFTAAVAATPGGVASALPDALPEALRERLLVTPSPTTAAARRAFYDTLATFVQQRVPAGARER